MNEKKICDDVSGMNFNDEYSSKSYNTDDIAGNLVSDIRLFIEESYPEIKEILYLASLAGLSVMGRHSDFSKMASIILENGISTKERITFALLMQMPFFGWPPVLDSFGIFSELSGPLEIDDNSGDGDLALRSVYGEDYGSLIEQLNHYGTMVPEMIKSTYSHIYTTGPLLLREREILAVFFLSVSGRKKLLSGHIRAAERNGVSSYEINAVRCLAGIISGRKTDLRERL